jgi:crotonobetainyl-CoA:carnitine CoA-transferase CaiB-like acyl-CoA transferase
LCAREHCIKVQTLLSDFVHKVRPLPTEIRGSPISAYYSAANYAKVRQLLDVADPPDYETVIHHLRETHIAIADYKSGTAHKLNSLYAYVNQELGVG